MYTLLYLKWMTNKDLLYSTWSSAQCYVAACLGGDFGGEGTHVYIWLSPFLCSEAIATLLICYETENRKVHEIIQGDFMKSLGTLGNT